MWDTCDIQWDYLTSSAGKWNRGTTRAPRRFQSDLFQTIAPIATLSRIDGDLQNWILLQKRYNAYNINMLHNAINIQTTCVQCKHYLLFYSDGKHPYLPGKPFAQKLCPPHGIHCNILVSICGTKTNQPMKQQESELLSQLAEYIGFGLSSFYMRPLFLFFLCLFVCLFVCLFACLFVCLFVCLFACLFACLLACLSVGWFIYFIYFVSLDFWVSSLIRTTFWHVLALDIYVWHYFNSFQLMPTQKSQFFRWQAHVWTQQIHMTCCSIMNSPRRTRYLQVTT